MRHKWVSLVIWIISFKVIGFCLGQVTEAQLDPWYMQLSKSYLTPPGYVFGIVWSILYVILAIIGWKLHRQGSAKLFRLFLLQMLMNWAWTPIFFQLHWIGLSFIWLLILTLLNGILIIKLVKHEHLLTVFLLPYLIWLSFASYLNGVIFILN